MLRYKIIKNDDKKFYYFFVLLNIKNKVWIEKIHLY